MCADGGGASYTLSTPCWTCIDYPPGSYCTLAGASAKLAGPVGQVSRATTTVSVPGGGPYRLRYRLQNPGRNSSNSWQAVIGPVDNNFTWIVVDSLTNSSLFDWTFRELPFNLQTGTTAVTLTIGGRNVRPSCIRQWIALAFRKTKLGNLMSAIETQSITGFVPWASSYGFHSPSPLPCPSPPPSSFPYYSPSPRGELCLPRRHRHRAFPLYKRRSVLCGINLNDNYWCISLVKTLISYL
jgi:hypothetical protein